MAVFDNKIFNAEVFGKYVDTIPRVKQNALLRAGVFRTRSELKTMLAEQTGGNYITLPMFGRIGGDGHHPQQHQDLQSVHGGRGPCQGLGGTGFLHRRNRPGFP